MPGAAVAPSVLDEARLLVRFGEKVCFAAGAAVIIMLSVAASPSMLKADDLSWWAAAVPLTVASTGAALAVRAGVTHHRFIVADVSWRRLACQLLAIGAIFVFFGIIAAYGAVDALDAFVEDFDDKAEQQRLRVIFAATFVQSAAIGLLLSSTTLEVARAFTSTRDRITFAVLVFVLAYNLLPVALLHM